MVLVPRLGKQGQRWASGRFRPSRRMTVLLKPIKAFLVFFFFFLSFLSLQLGFDLDREVYPLVVHAVVDEGDGRGALCHPPHTLPSGGTRPGTFPAGVGQQALTAPPQAHAHTRTFPSPGGPRGRRWVPERGPS